MTVAAVIFMLSGVLALLVGSLWTVVSAFRVSVLWGAVVFFFSPASIAFAFKHWEMARRPLYASIAGLLLVLGGFQLLPAEGALGASLAQHFSKDEPASETKALPPMFAAQKQMELQIKLVALQEKEAALLERKAALNPKDRQGAIALTKEINDYNAELKPLLQEMRDRGMTASR